MSKVEELYEQTRNHPVYRHLIPMESVLSFPVPHIEGDQAYLRFFVYQRGSAPKGQPRPVYRPYVRLSVEYPSGRLVEFVELSFVEGMPEGPATEQVDVALDFSVRGLTFDDVVAARTALFRATENMVHLLQQVGVSGLTADAYAEYKRLFDILVEPGLKSYYRALNPLLFPFL